jgi:hypothetical protein
LVSQKHKEYFDLKSNWEIILADLEEKQKESPNLPPPASNNPESPGEDSENLDEVTRIAEQKYRIMKDVVRTDRRETYFGGSEEGDVAPLEQSPGGTVTLIESLEKLRNVLMTYSTVHLELGECLGISAGEKKKTKTLKICMKNRLCARNE